MAFQTREGQLKLITYVGIRRGGRLLVVDYETPPNPDKPGWWIPAPEVAWGEDPMERAARVAAGLGYPDAAGLRLMDVESFTMGEGNWHVIVHFVLDVAHDPTPGPDVRRWQWLAPDASPGPEGFAHKGWEERLARRMLAFAPEHDAAM
jgi:hypothetical protein